MVPEQVLVKYLTDMGAWESECAKLDAERIAGRIGFMDAMQAGMDRYLPIFDRYCSKARATPRESLSYSTPPDYNPETEKIIRTAMLSADVAEIQTQQVSGHQKRHLYRLVLERDQWRLFEKFIIAADGEMIPDDL